MGKARNRKKARSGKPCYLCNGALPDSRDHIVAQGFFAQPYPPNLVTLPAHQLCQQKYSDSEDYVRNIFAGLASGVPGSLAPGDTVSRAFNRNAPLREHIASGLMGAHDVLTDGGVYLGTSPALRFDPERFFPALRKIVRALAFHHFGIVLQPADADFRWKMHDRPDPQWQGMLRLLRASLPGLIYPGIFESRYSSGSQHSFWLLNFYQRFAISCVLPHSGKLPVRTARA